GHCVHRGRVDGGRRAGPLGGPGAGRAGHGRRRGQRHSVSLRGGRADPVRGRALSPRHRSPGPETARVRAPTISTAVVRVDAIHPDESAMRAAGALVQTGGLVAFPTESFYGLGADALDADAIGRVFEVKGRPESKPLLVLVDSVDMVARLTTRIGAGAQD